MNQILSVPTCLLFVFTQVKIRIHCCKDVNKVGITKNVSYDEQEGAVFTDLKACSVGRKMQP